MGETFFASSIIAYWPLAVSMPPTKGMGHMSFLLDEMGLDKMGLDEMG